MKNHRRVYLFDELDIFISSSYGLTKEQYIQIIDHEMTEQDAEDFINFSIEERFAEGIKVLFKYYKL